MSKQRRSTQFGSSIVLAVVIVTIVGTAVIRRSAYADGVASEVRTVPANRLAPENVALSDQVGLWDVTETVWASPSAAPVTTTGLVAERRMVGAMLEEILRPAADTAQKDIQRIDYLTFNHISGRYEYVSMDTRPDIGLMPAWSFSRAEQDGRIVVEHEPFVIPSEGPNPKALMLRMTSTISRQDADHNMKEQHFVTTDGTGAVWLAHRYVYVRKQRNVTRSGRDPR